MHQLVPEYDVEMLTKNEASRQIDRILAAYGSLQKVREVLYNVWKRSHGRW